MEGPAKNPQFDQLAQLRKYCKIGVKKINTVKTGEAIALRGEENIMVQVTSQICGSGKQELLRRVMLTGEQHRYRDIGWVVDRDAKRCMVCQTKFGLFTWRHHCRLCGDIL